MANSSRKDLRDCGCETGSYSSTTFECGCLMYVFFAGLVSFHSGSSYANRKLGNVIPVAMLDELEQCLGIITASLPALTAIVAKYANTISLNV